MKDETRNSDSRNSAFGLILFRVSIFAFRVSFSFWLSFSRVSIFAFRVSFPLWRWLRAVLDDDAYDRYLTHRVTLSEAERQRGGVEGSAALSPSEFYRLRLERKYSRPTRCC